MGIVGTTTVRQAVTRTAQGLRGASARPEVRDGARLLARQSQAPWATPQPGMPLDVPLHAEGGSWAGQWRAASCPHPPEAAPGTLAPNVHPDHRPPKRGLSPGLAGQELTEGSRGLSSFRKPGQAASTQLTLSGQQSPRPSPRGGQPPRWSPPWSPHDTAPPRSTPGSKCPSPQLDPSSQCTPLHKCVSCESPVPRQSRAPGGGSGPHSPGSLPGQRCPGARSQRGSAGHLWGSGAPDHLFFIGGREGLATQPSGSR